MFNSSLNVNIVKASNGYSICIDRPVKPQPEGLPFDVEKFTKAMMNAKNDMMGESWKRDLEQPVIHEIPKPQHEMMVFADFDSLVEALREEFGEKEKLQAFIDG
ncbi:MAG: hypothetical protein AAFZ15_17360 [Bacteroidota bacterium]